MTGLTLPLLGENIVSFWLALGLRRSLRRFRSARAKTLLWTDVNDAFAEDVYDDESLF